MLSVAIEFLKSSLDRNVRFTAIGVSRMLYGLQSMSSNSPEVRSILSLLSHVVNNCQEALDIQAVGNTLYGMQGMNSKYDEVQSLLVALTDKVNECPENIDAQAFSNALYGLQCTDADDATVRRLLRVLRNKSTVTFDMNMSDHATFDLMDLQRSFILCRQHVVAMLGSETLRSEYSSKLDAELMQRRQRRQQQTRYSATGTQFQSQYEKEVYSRVLALANQCSQTRLTITDVCHNKYLLNCLESDITFRVCDGANVGLNKAAIVVNIEVDGTQHNKPSRIRFDRLRDEELRRQGIHVARISNIDLSIGGGATIDDFLNKTLEEVGVMLSDMNTRY